MDAPEVRYARSGDVNVAYAVVGDGPFDLVLAGGWVVSNLDVAWEGPAADFFTGLSAFSRLILFDKRGTGLLDRVTTPDLCRTELSARRSRARVPSLQFSEPPGSGRLF